MSAVVKSYCEAIYHISLSNNKVEEYKNYFKSVLNVLKENRDLKKVFESPNISKDDKKALIDKLFVFDESFASFLKVLVDNNRFNLFKEVFDEFNILANTYLQIEEAKVISAIKLSDEELLDIKKMLEKKLGKTVEITEEVDSDLIAGVRVILQNEVIDNSMETQLDNLKNIILSGKVG